MEVVDTVGLTSSTTATNAPVVALELRSQIDDWYHHLPSSLRLSLDQSFLFDTHKAYLRCAYHALIAVVTWPFDLHCKMFCTKLSYPIVTQKPNESPRVLTAAWIPVEISLRRAKRF
jgi:hypothetical protein